MAPSLGNSSGSKAVNTILFYLFYAEMVENMKKVASFDHELTVEERNLLSVAYKNVIGARRAAWRIVSSLEQKEEQKGAPASKLHMLSEYRKLVSNYKIYNILGIELKTNQYQSQIPRCHCLNEECCRLCAGCVLSDLTYI